MVSNLIIEEDWGFDDDYECQHNNIMGDSFAVWCRDCGALLIDVDRQKIYWETE